jgi:hypothetical protein
VTDDCEKLDAWLADAIAADEAASFAEHLAHCEACRDAVEQQRWIDGLLQSDVRASLEPVPDRLMELVHATPRRSDHRSLRRHIAVLAAVAAIVLVAVGTALVVHDRGFEQGDGSAETDIAANVPDRIEESTVDVDGNADDKPERATFVSNQDMIAVPVDSTDDDVTIVQLYRTTEAERRSRSEFAFQLNPTKPSGG